MKTTLDRIKNECNLTANVWYLDDGTIVGNRIEVEKALKIIKDESENTGLNLNLNKCELWSANKSIDLNNFPT